MQGPAPEVQRQMQWERSKTQWMGAPVQPQSPQQQQQHQPPRLEAEAPVAQQPPVAAEGAQLPGPLDVMQAGAGTAGILLFGDFKQQEVARFGPQTEPKPKQVTVELRPTCCVLRHKKGHNTCY